MRKGRRIEIVSNVKEGKGGAEKKTGEEIKWWMNNKERKICNQRKRSATVIKKNCRKLKKRKNESEVLMKQYKFNI